MFCDCEWVGCSMAEGSGVFCEWRVVGCSVMGRSRVYVIGGE